MRKLCLLLFVVFISLNLSGQTSFGSTLLIDSFESVWDVKTADLDNDGDQDVIACSRGIAIGEVRWYENLGNGVFDKNVISSFGNNHYQVFATDLNNDGYIDIISVASYNSGPNAISVTWYKNNGNSTFIEKTLPQSTIENATTIYVDDLNGDNYKDILVGSYSSGSTTLVDNIVWFENLGNELFSNQQIVNVDSVNWGGGTTSIYAKDIDNDNDLDVIAALTNEISWFENDGNGNFENRHTISTNVAATLNVHVMDVNNDNNLDVISTQGGKVVWFENQGQGVFSTEILIQDFENAYYVNSADLDNNGFEDILLGGNNSFGGNTNSYILNNGDGTFNAIVEMASNAAGLGGVCAADLDNDGDNDVLFAAVVDNALVWNENLYEANFASVFGNVFEDANQNGIQEIGENGLGGVLISSNGFGGTFTNQQGDYILYLPQDEMITLSAELDINSTNGYCTNDYTIYTQTFPSSNGNYNLETDTSTINDINFGVNVQQQNVFDVGIYTLNVFNGNEAGADFNAWIDFKANGTINNGCKLRITHDPLLSLVQAGITPTLETSTFVEWEFQNGQVPSLYCMEMIWNLDDAAVEGDTLHWEATYDCLPGVDGCPVNNEVIRDIPIISGPLRLAVDDTKMFSMHPSGDMPEVISNDEVLSYVISFQNVLESTAENIIIIDTLPEQLDINSISNPFSNFSDYNFSISNDGVLKWEINDANLTIADFDIVNSYGFVQFNVKLKPSLPQGTIIENKAVVNYDNLAERTTNTIIHRIDNSVGIKDHLSLITDISIYPNPTSDFSNIIIISPNTLNSDLKVFNSLGNELLNYQVVSNSNFYLDVRDLAPGIYILNVYDKEESKLLRSEKLIIN